jgi:hypothetical protein
VAGLFAALICGALASVALPGCSGSAPERSEPLPAPTETPEIFQRVFIDSPGRADHGQLVAILGNAVLTAGEREHEVTRVYDRNYRILGFYLGSGACYRLSKGRTGEEVEESLGNHEPDECIERICGVDGPFRREQGP